MSKVYISLFDFFNSVANYFWHKHINSLKARKRKL